MFIGRAAPRYGTWTPVISFDTPGSLAITHTIQWGEWVLDGRRVSADFSLTTSAFSLGTASGNLLISGLPYAAKTLTNAVWSGSLSLIGGVTKASYTQFNPRILSAGQIIRITASGSGMSAGNLSATDTYASIVIIQGSIAYPIA